MTFLKLAVGVVWCFKLNFEVASFICCTIRPETDLLSLLCHGFNSDHTGLRTSIGLPLWTQANVDPRPLEQTCPLSSTALRLPRPSDICTLVLLGALLVPLSCTLPCRFQKVIRVHFSV